MNLDIDGLEIFGTHQKHIGESRVIGGISHLLYVSFHPLSKKKTPTVTILRGCRSDSQLTALVDQSHLCSLNFPVIFVVLDYVQTIDPNASKS